MPKLDKTFDDVQESGAGEFVQFDPGVYMCRIQAVRTNWVDGRGQMWTSDQKSYVKLIVDVDEGEHAGRFSDEYWASEEKDWGHTLYMSWTERALGMLKHTFAAMDEANPGFDAKAAFEADAWDKFVGKRILVVWRGEEYTANNGTVRVRTRPDRAVTASDKPKVTVELPGGEKVPWDDYKARPVEQAAQDADDVSVPF